MKRRILIVTNGQLSRNPRPLKEAHTLGAAGFDVTVLMVRNHAASEAHDAAILRTASFRRDAIDMLRDGAVEPGRVFVRRLALWGARKLASRFRMPTIHSLGPTRTLLARARRHGGDLTIVHNEIAHWVGTQLLREGRRVAADIEDWHSEDLLPRDRVHRPIAQIQRTERSLLHECAYTTTTSHALADALHARYGGERPHVVTNSFPLQPKPPLLALGKPPAFLWFSQTLGPGRGLEFFFDAWDRTSQPSRVILVGEPTSGYVDELLARLPAERRAAVEIKGLVSPTELPALIAQHDIGLALEPPSPLSRNLTITNKILQYLNAGLAVVASDTAGQREVLVQEPEAGAIVDFSDPGALAQRLDALLMDRAALASQQSAARRLAERTYCWEREAPRLLALVEQALRSSRPAPVPTVA